MKTWTLTVLFAVSAVAASAGDLKGKAEVDGFGGAIHITDENQAPNGHKDKAIFGGSFNYGVASMVQLFGEYSYVAVGENVSAKAQQFTGGVKPNLMKSDKVEPYVLVGFGGSRFSCDGCDAQNDKALHIGGGVRFYAGKNWGITPEVRWVRIFQTGDDTNLIAYTGGIFFQWGK